MHKNDDVKPDTGAVFLDQASLDRGDLDLSPLAEVADGMACHASTTPAEVGERAREAWCVIVNKVMLDRDFFAARPNLRLVCIVATGTNNVDLQAAAAHGVTVVNCRGYGATTLAQHVLMLILVLSRSLPQYLGDVAAGRWSTSSQFCLLDHPIRELGGRRLGLVGYGAIARQVERVCAALGMEVVVAERHGQAPRAGRLAHDEVLETADVVSLHCPLTAATEGLIGRAALRRMRPEALLINTARGGLVDNHALLAALEAGDIAGAAVDVVEPEPPPADHPLLAARPRNLIVTPHCAWGSLEARRRIVDQTVENIRAWRAGEPVRAVAGGGD